MLVCLRFHFSLGQQAYDTLMIYWPGWRFHRIWYHLNGCLFKNRKITFYSDKKSFYHRKIFNLPRPRVWAKYDGAIDGARLIVPPKFDGASVPFPPWDPHDTQPSIYELSLDFERFDLTSWRVNSSIEDRIYRSFRWRHIWFQTLFLALSVLAAALKT